MNMKRTKQQSILQKNFEENVLKEDRKEKKYLKVLYTKLTVKIQKKDKILETRPISVIMINIQKKYGINCI